jgi:hypothetical protein
VGCDGHVEGRFRATGARGTVAGFSNDAAHLSIQKVRVSVDEGVWAGKQDGLGVNFCGSPSCN